jgi:hypothetical protein
MAHPTILKKAGFSTVSDTVAMLYPLAAHPCDPSWLRH